MIIVNLGVYLFLTFVGMVGFFGLLHERVSLKNALTAIWHTDSSPIGLKTQEEFFVFSVVFGEFSLLECGFVVTVVVAIPSRHGNPCRVTYGLDPVLHPHYIRRHDSARKGRPVGRLRTIWSFHPCTSHI